LGQEREKDTGNRKINRERTATYGKEIGELKVEKFKCQQNRGNKTGRLTKPIDREIDGGAELGTKRKNDISLEGVGEGERWKKKKKNVSVFRKQIVQRAYAAPECQNHGDSHKGRN